MNDAWWKNRIESDPPVKAWTERGVSVVCKLEGVTPQFVHLVNLTDRNNTYRGHLLKPYEVFFSTETWIVRKILGRDSTGDIRAVPSSKNMPPLAPMPEGKRFINLNRKAVGT